MRLPSYVLVLSFVVACVALFVSSDRDMALPLAEQQFERLVSQELAGADVDIRGLTFRLNSKERLLFVKASELWIEGLGDAPDTVLKQIGADFNLSDVLYGDLNPQSLNWGGLEFGVVSDANGMLSFGLNPTPGAGQSGSSSMPFFVSEAHASAPDFSAGSDENGERRPFLPEFFQQYTDMSWVDQVFAVLPELDTVSLEDVDLSYQDLRSGFGVKTQAAAMQLFRDTVNGGGLLTLSGQIAVGAPKVGSGAVSTEGTDWNWELLDVDLAARFDANNQAKSLELTAVNLVPSQFLPLFPDNQLLEMLDRKVVVSAGLRFDAAGSLSSLSGSIQDALSEEVSLSVRPKQGGIWRVEALAANINPNNEPLLLDLFEFLEPVDAAFSGTSTLLYDGFGELQVYQLDLFQTEAGTVSLPELWSQPQSFRNAAVSVQGDLTTSDIHTSGLQLNGSSGDLWQGMEVVASVQTTSRGTRVDLDLATDERLDHSVVASLWPDVSEEDQARTWFLNSVRGGSISDAEMTLQLSSDGPNQPLQVGDIKANFNFRNANVLVTPGLGRSQIDNGTVRVVNQEIAVSATAGTLGPISGERLRMSMDFDNPYGGLLDLQVDVSGDAVAGARYIAGAGLGLEALSTSLPLNQAQGRVTGNFKATIPLTDDDRVFDDLFAYDFGGTLRDFRLAAYLGEQDILGTEARLFSTNNRTQVSGNATLGSRPLGYASRASFDLVFAHQSQDLSVRGQFNSTVAAAEPFIGPLAGFGNGGLSGQYTYRASIRAGARARADVVADLSQAEIDLPFVFYKKPMGRPTSVSAGIELVGGKPTSIPRFNFTTPQSEASGQVAFADGRTDKLEVLFDGLVFNGSTIENARLSIDGKQIGAVVQGGVVNAVSAAESLFGQGATRQTDQGTRVGFGLDPQMVIVVRFNDLARVILPNGRFFNDVSASFSLQNNGLEHMRFRGQPPAVHQGRPADVGILTASIEPTPGGYTFNLRTDDAGSAFYASNLNDSVRLGNVQVKAYSPVAFPHGGWKGSLNAENIFLFNAPIFGRLFQVASLTGIGELLSGTGLGFSQVIADFTYSPGNIFVDNWQMLGPSIGMTGQGGINFRDQTINVRGTVTPLGALNEITHQLPLIGTLLNGLDGGGLFSATYTIRGPFSDPGMFVNPWTSLTPGAFRDLYRAVTGSF